MSDPKNTAARAIRVFVSSTFRDMHAERDELVKHAFPKLRKLCEARDVTWGEVDLRWGITKEQKNEGKVLPIVLDEVRRCRPYFIGILGSRYGSVPETIPIELIQQEPWLASDLGRSVTELEILHGVLNNPAMAGHAFFYFRDPSYADDTEPESEANAARLTALKNRIRVAKIPVHENYTDPKSFGELVESDLGEAIDREFPKIRLDPLDQEAADHEQYAEDRRRVYVVRPEYFNALNEFAARDGAPLVVLGESGLGKSALLANWAGRYRQDHPELPVFLHFIGATRTSADWAAIIRRMMGEFQRLLGVELEIPVRADHLCVAFANSLRLVSAKRRVVIVLDALNQLEDRDGALDLVWLPSSIPPNVRFVLSTLPGRPLEEIQKRGWPTLEVKPLELEERLRLIPEYLRQYSRTLETDRIERIARMPQCSSPLYLEALLNEMRLFGSYELLEAQIANYLKADNAAELYVMILERWERDYEQDRPGWVAKALTMLWAARQGLSESELREALGTADGPLPHAVWSALYFAADHALVNRSGLIGPAHDHFRQAIETKWLGSPGKRRTTHLAVASYFTKERPETNRALDEVPWQLMCAAEWHRLRDFLAGPDTIEKLWHRDARMLRRYWHEIEASSPLRLAESYEGLLDRSPNEAIIEAQIAAVSLLRESGASEIVLSWCRKVRSVTGPGDRENRDIIDKMEVAILQDRGEFTLVVPLLGDLISRSEKGNKALLTISLFERGSALNSLGRYDEGLQDLLRAENLANEIGDSRLMAKVALERGHSALYLGDLATAEAQLQTAERMSRSGGDNVTLATSLDSLGSIRMVRGDLSTALRLFDDEVGICRECSDYIGLARALTAKGNVLGRMPNTDDAVVFQLFDEAELLCEKSSNPIGHACAIGSRGRHLRRLGRFAEALACRLAEMAIWKPMNTPNHLAACLLEQCATHYAMGNMSEARRCLDSANALREHIGAQPQNDLDRVAKAILDEQVVIPQAQTLPGAYDSPAKAMEAEGQLRNAIASDSLANGTPPATTWRHLLELGNLLLVTGRPSEAAVQLEKALILARKILGIHPNTSANLNLLAQARVELGEFDVAKKLLDEALEVEGKGGSKWSGERGQTLTFLGLLMFRQGRLAESERYYRQALRMLELILPAEHEALSIPLSGLGCVLDDLGKKEESEKMHRRALANDLRAFGPDHPRLAIRNHNLGCLLQSMERLAEARECFIRSLEIDRRARGIGSREVVGGLARIAEISVSMDDFQDAAKRIGEAVQLLRGSESSGKDTCFKLFYLCGKVHKELSPAEGYSLVRSALGCAKAAFADDSSETGRMLRRMVLAPEPSARNGAPDPALGRRRPVDEGEIRAMLAELNRSQVEDLSIEDREGLLVRALRVRKSSEGKFRQALTQLMNRLAISLERPWSGGDLPNETASGVLSDDRKQQFEASSAWLGIAERAINGRDWELATDAAESSLELLRVLCDGDDPNPALLLDYASALMMKGEIWLERDNAEIAKYAFEQAKATYERLALIEPKKALFLRGLAVACDKLGDLARADDALSDAQGFYEQALPVFRQLAHIDQDFSRDLSLCLSKLGELGLAQEDLPAAKTALEEHFALATRIASEDLHEIDHQRDLAGAHGRMAQLAAAADEMEDALSHTEAAHNIIKSVAESDRSNITSQQDLAGSLFNLGMLLARTGNPARGARMVSQSHAMLKGMDRVNQLDAKGRSLLRHIQGMFERNE
jgi:tetratricopeptide (TPR) repeat protein